MAEGKAELEQRVTKLRALSEAEKVALICGQTYQLSQIEERVEALKCAHEKGECVVCKDKDKTIEELNDTIQALRARLYGKSSEKTKKGGDGNGSGSGKKAGNAVPRARLPSEQYPKAKIVEETIQESKPPQCPECQEEMTDSGLREISERLELIPMEIYIVRMNRVRYHCKCCQSAPYTAALPARIAPYTSLNDSVLIESAIAKFYDLIPTERFAKMLSRSCIDVSDKLILSAQNYLAQAYQAVYFMLKQEVITSRVIHVDESPHRMLERNEGHYAWYLWSFCTPTSVYFEIHSTRAGSVSIDFLKESKARVLVSDVYSGYIRTIREINEERKSQGVEPLISAYCNDHARRYFFQAQEKEAAQKAVELYDQIYLIEAKVKKLILNPEYEEPENSAQALKLRQSMDPLFEKIYDLSCEILLDHAPRSQIAQAAHYFLNNLAGLTVFLTNLEIPISNARAERSVRSPAVGRNTGLGTHSRKGAETTAILFSIFESCKLNEVNPREYCRDLAILYKTAQPLMTPYQYKILKLTKPPPE